MHQARTGKSERNLRFLIAGGIGILLYLDIFFNLTEYGIWYGWAAIIAFVIYLGANFPAQKYWVFRNNDKKYTGLQFAQFASVALLNWIVNTSLLHILVKYYSYEAMPVQLTLTLVAILPALIVFAYIFRKRS